MQFLHKKSALRSLIRHWRQKYFSRVKLAVTALKRRLMKDTTVIAITGSSTKTTTTALLHHILSVKSRVVSNEFNNAPDTIARTIRNAPLNCEFAVLEVAAGNTPQIKECARIIKPDVAIVMMIEMEHYSTYRTKEAVAFEKGHLVEALSKSRLALLNADDQIALGMAERSAARVVTFGRSENADYRAYDVTFSLQDGLRMRVGGCGHDMEITANLFGRHFYLPVLAAVACALELGIPSETVQRAVASFRGYIDRCGVLNTANGPVFVLDTCKAPFHSITLPMDTLSEIEAPRKTIVIGQIADYSGNSRKPYTFATKFAAARADRVFLVGPNADRARFNVDEFDCEIARFQNVCDLTQHLQKTAVPGEVILLKSSKNIHLERAALAFQREVNCWAEACGYDGNCYSCGLYPVAFADHPPGKQARKTLVTKLGTNETDRKKMT